MEQKILERLSALSNEISDLANKREKLVGELRQIDMNMEVLSAIMFELKTLLENKEE